MCVIICIEDGQYPAKDTLLSAEKLNSHGGSIAWLNKSGTKSYRKGISAKQINKIIENKLKRNNIKTAIIHFRIASVGGVDKALCHPFEVTNNVELNQRGDSLQCDLLFHNGTWTDYSEVILEMSERLGGMKLPKGKWSDSRVMALISSKFGHKQLPKLVTGWNKIALLTTKGIVKYGDGWINHKGNACSNNYFVDDGKPKFGGMYDYGYGSYGINGYKQTYYNAPATDLKEMFALDEVEKKICNELVEKYGITETEIMDQLDYGRSVYDIQYELEEEENKIIRDHVHDYT